MSILLTSNSKKKTSLSGTKKVTSEKQQQQQQRSNPSGSSSGASAGACFNPGSMPMTSAVPPPGSTAFRIVWYWMLNGIATTAVYNKGSTEIWCNGDTIPITERNDKRYGHVYDFKINLRERRSSHLANLVRMDDGHYILYADGHLIEEHRT